jgi:hypothetical protein
MAQFPVDQLKHLGPLPSCNDEEADIEAYERLLSQVVRPVSDEEAKILLSLFGPDDCYGMAWTLVHLIETAPHWPLRELLSDETNEWMRLLRLRASNRESRGLHER